MVLEKYGQTAPAHSVKEECGWQKPVRFTITPERLVDAKRAPKEWDGMS